MSLLSLSFLSLRCLSFCPSFQSISQWAEWKPLGITQLSGFAPGVWWGCTTRSSSGIWKLSAALAHKKRVHSTYPLGESFISPHFHPSSNVLWAPLRVRHGASPQQDRARKTTRVSALLMSKVRKLASEITELDLPLMPESPLKHYHPPQPLIKYLASDHLRQFGTAFRFWGGKNPLNVPHHVLSMALKYEWTHLFPWSRGN